MDLFTLGASLGALPMVRELRPDLYELGSPAATLAGALGPLVEQERERRREAEKLARELRKDDPQPVLTGGLLGFEASGGNSYMADSLPWYDLAKDLGALQRFGDALGLPVGQLAQTIARLLFPPNWELFFWMGRALDSADAAEALRWKDEASAARAEADAMRQKAAARGKKAADGLWGREGGTRDQRVWWERAWAAAKAETPALRKKTFVKKQWPAYLATKPGFLVEPETVRDKWLRGK